MSDYSDTVKRLKSQWQAMLDSGKMPLFEIQDANDEWCIFNVDLVQSLNNSWYFIYETTDGLKRLRVEAYCDCLDTYLATIHDWLILELA